MSRLLKATFECEVITPMFLAGADQEGAELRIPSIIGGLRYWFRTFQSVDSSHLYELESEVFGDTNKKSKINIRLSTSTFHPKSAQKFTKNRNSGTAYLWYSTTLGRNNRKYIKPGIKFRLSFTARKKHKKFLIKAIQSLWLLSNFGGLGTRSRRCAGSFKTKLLDANIKEELPIFNINNEKILQRELQKISPSNNSNSKPDYDCFVKDYSNIWVFKLGDVQTWEKAVEKAGKEMQSYRAKKGLKEENGKDYKTIKQFIKKGKVPDTVERVTFGLPLRFQYRSLDNGPVTIKPFKNYKRRSSPLWMTIKKFGESYFIVLTFFDSLFLPENKLSLKGKTSRVSNESLVPDFVQKKFNNATKIY